MIFLISVIDHDVADVDHERVYSTLKEKLLYMEWIHFIYRSIFYFGDIQKSLISLYVPLENNERLWSVTEIYFVLTPT